jgi:hypothetical protein
MVKATWYLQAKRRHAMQIIQNKDMCDVTFFLIQSLNLLVSTNNAVFLAWSAQAFVYWLRS